jgi:hypothetical protein
MSGRRRKTMSNVSSFIMFDSEGNVDIGATQEKFNVALAKYTQEKGMLRTEVLAAINAVFDELPNARMNLEALKSFSMSKIQKTPESYNVVNETWEEVIRSNLFWIKAGRSAAVYRVEDLYTRQNLKDELEFFLTNKDKVRKNAKKK